MVLAAVAVLVPQVATEQLLGYVVMVVLVQRTLLLDQASPALRVEVAVVLLLVLVVQVLVAMVLLVRLPLQRVLLTLDQAVVVQITASQVLAAAV